MRKIKSSDQQGSAGNPNAPQRPVAKKGMSEGMFKIVCLLVFLAVAAGGLFLNLQKVPGNLTLFGYSLPKPGSGSLSKEDQRRAIMESDMNDDQKARKLQLLAQQE
jgi:hypothetical protein